MEQMRLRICDPGGLEGKLLYQLGIHLVLNNIVYCLRLNWLLELACKQAVVGGHGGYHIVDIKFVTMSIW